MTRGKGRKALQKYTQIARQNLRVALATLICVVVMLGVYALLGACTVQVVLGAAVGLVLAVGNFFFLSVTVANALDRAAREEDPRRAQISIQASGTVRLLALAVIYVLLFRAKVCDPVAALLPLIFAQIAIKFTEFFRKDDEGGDAAL